MLLTFIVGGLGCFYLHDHYKKSPALQAVVKKTKEKYQLLHRPSIEIITYGDNKGSVRARESRFSPWNYWNISGEREIELAENPRRYSIEECRSIAEILNDHYREIEAKKKILSVEVVRPD